jgi:hypothetical protein
MLGQAALWEIRSFSVLEVWVVYLPILQQFLPLAMSSDVDFGPPEREMRVDYLLRTLDSRPISFVTIDDVPSGIVRIQEALNFASVI